MSLFKKNSSTTDEAAEGSLPFGEKVKQLIKSARFKHGSLAIAFTAGTIVIVILLNIVVGILSNRFPSMNIDLSPKSLNTLSQTSLDVLKTVEQPTTIYIIAKEDDVKQDKVLSDTAPVKYSQVGTLVQKMAEKNTKISYKYIDLDANPGFASKYTSSGVTLTTGNVIIETDKRFKILQPDDLFSAQTSQDGTTRTIYSTVDSALASGVSFVNSATVPVVAFDTGHSEMLPSDAIKKVLSSNNFETKDFNVLTDAIPDSAQIIALTAPNTDYTADEIKKLDAFLKDTSATNSRFLWVTFHPGEADLPNLNNFLAEWGIKAENEQIVESSTKNVFYNSASYILGDLGTELSFGGKSDYGYLAMAASRPITKLFASQNGITTYTLVNSKSTSYALPTGQDAKATGNEEKKAYPLAVLAQSGRNVGNKTLHSGVLAFGSSMAFTDGIINVNTYGNGQLLVDLTRYSTDTSSSSNGITITPTALNAPDITITAATANFLGIGIFTIILPLCILGVGFYVFMKRRHL